MGKDSLMHLKATVMVSNALSLKDFLKNPFLHYNNKILYNKDYPPLYYLIATMILRFFNAPLMFMTSSLFLCLLIFSSYKIAKLINDETSGLLTSVIICFYPIIHFSSLAYNLEIAQAAMVSLSLYLLIKTEYFNNRKFSLLFGIVFALSMLTKQQALFFIIGPLFIVLMRTFVRFKIKKNQLHNLIIAFLIFILISTSFFYYIYFEPISWQKIVIRSRLTSALDIDSKHWFTLDHLIFYFKILVTPQIGIINLIILLFSGAIFYHEEKYAEYRSLFSAWIIIPFIILTFIPAKFHEYTISYLPALALITGLGISSIRNKFIKIGSIVLVCILCLYQCAGYFFPSYIPERLTSAFKEYRSVLMMGETYKVEPAYKTVYFFNKPFQDQKIKVGILNYADLCKSSWWGELIAVLFNLYNSEIKIEDIKFDETEQILEGFDYVIFCTLNKDEKWIKKDNFIKESGELNKFLLSKGLPSYLISLDKLEKIIKYASRLELIHCINDSVVNIYIYKKQHA